MAFTTNSRLSTAVEAPPNRRGDGMGPQTAGATAHSSISPRRCRAIRRPSSFARKWPRRPCLRRPAFIPVILGCRELRERTRRAHGRRLWRKIAPRCRMWPSPRAAIRLSARCRRPRGARRQCALAGAMVFQPSNVARHAAHRVGYSCLAASMSPRADLIPGR